MRYKSLQELNDSIKGVVKIEDGWVSIINEAAVQGDLVDRLLFNAVFNEDTEILNKTRWLIKAIAFELGIRSAQQRKTIQVPLSLR